MEGNQEFAESKLVRLTQAAVRGALLCELSLAEPWTISDLELWRQDASPDGPLRTHIAAGALLCGVDTAEKIRFIAGPVGTLALRLYGADFSALALLAGGDRLSLIRRSMASKCAVRGFGCDAAPLVADGTLLGALLVVFAA